MAKPKQQRRSGAAAPAAQPGPIMLPKGLREAAIDATTLDPEKRTFEVVWTTGAEVTRRDFWTGERWIEALEVSDKAIRLDRLNSGRAAVLDSHDSWSLDSVLGVVERAWIKGGEGRAQIRLSEREDVAGIVSDIAGGIICNISCGYITHSLAEEMRDGMKVRRATDWEPVEISFVPVPADPDAGMRSAPQGAALYPCIITRAAPTTQEIPMETIDSAAGNPPVDDTTTRAAPPVAPPAPAPAPSLAPVVDLSAERARSAEIMTLAQRHAMPAEFAPKHIADGSTVDAVRGLILDDLAKRSGETRQTPHIRVTRDEGDTIRRAVESAIRLRANPGSVKPDSPEFEMARSWRGMSLIEMGRSYVEETMGVRLRGLNRREQATVLLGLELRAGMHSTSDFPNLLANVASKRLRDAYLAAPQNWKLISRQSNSPDFKTKSVVQLSNLPQFKQVRESEEFEYAGLSEGVESYALLTYGRIVAITRQALINDDLGAFDRIPTLLGRAAAEKEAAIVWSLLTTNSGLGQTMNDGFNLFDNTNHGNYTSSGTAISVASLDIGRQAMRTQTGLAEEDPDPLNLMPKFLIVSPARETVAQQFLATIIPALNSSVNPFANSLTQITEARLSGNGWYLVADPATIDTIEYAYLEGEEGLYTEQRIGFEVDGIEVKGRIDFAAHVIDWRGFYKNAGA